MKHYLILIVLLSQSLFALNIGEKAPKQKVKHYLPNGTITTKAFTAKPKANSMLVVHGFAHCPWFKGSWPYLKKFQQDNPQITIKFILSDHAQAEIDDFVKQFHGKLPFTFIPTLRSSSKSLSYQLAAVYSASFWLFDENSTLVDKYIGIASPKVLNYFKNKLQKSKQ